MKFVGIFFVSYIVLCLGRESDEDDENRRFVPMFPYSSGNANNQNVPEDPSLIPMKAPKELVMEVAARSQQLKETRTAINLDEAEQKRLRESGQYWDRFWTEPLKEGRRLDSEVSEPLNKEPTATSTRIYSIYDAQSTPVVPDVPQSIAESAPKPDRNIYGPSYVPTFSMVNFGEPNDLEVKTGTPVVFQTEAPIVPTAEIIMDLDNKSTPPIEDTTTVTSKPIKNDKEDKTSKGKLVIALPGAEVQGSVKAKLVPGTKLYKLMKNAQKKLGENYQPKLLYIVNNY